MLEETIRYLGDNLRISVKTQMLNTADDIYEIKVSLFIGDVEISSDYDTIVISDA